MTHQELTEAKVQKLFSRWTFLLCLAGLGLNLLFSRLAIRLQLPLYLDNVGSVLTAALGGALPGMAVGFLTNVCNSLSDPISMYYGILTVVIAWLAARFSQQGWLKSWRGWLLSSLCFALIGGGVGSLMTWLLYGGGLGGIGEPYARLLCGAGFGEFWAQFTADILIDIPDKLLTMALVCLTLRFLPHRLCGLFPLGFVYDRELQLAPAALEESVRPRLRHTINMRVITVLTLSVTLISVMAVAISTLYHHQRLIANYEQTAKIFSDRVAACVDGDRVADYLAQGKAAPGYRETEAEMTEIYHSTDQITYLYVYSVRRDGCHVVFDIDTPELLGDEPGTVLPNEQYFYDQLDAFVAGHPVAPEYTMGAFGALITAYTPVRDSSGSAVAYAGADINISSYIMDMLVFVIQVLSILFATSLLIFTAALWYFNRYLTLPIRAIVDHSRALELISPEKWLESDAWRSRRPIHTGDELEELYNTVCEVEENASLNVQKLIETRQQLLQTKELERVNHELAATIKKADDANRAKTDFLSRMSHDIRTPLNAILGTAALARDEADDPAAVKESLDVIASSGTFLLGLINDILDINKIESGNLVLHPEVYTVTDFISSVNSTIRPLAEKKRLTFIFEMNCGHGVILVDKLRYKQIFFNLLSNAIKYTPEGGRVEFTAEPLEAPAGMAGVRNIIRDTGIGMSQEYMERLYQPFTRDASAVINKTEGSGLGLAIVKSIVDAMGGSIQVHSQLGKGTEFIVDLRLPIAQAAPQAGPEAQKDERLLLNKRILLVEDNAVNIRIARKLLEKKGCIVTEATDGQQAVERFSAAPVNAFHAVLMDIRMPVMDGLEATRRIRALDRADAKTIPIIAMTANAYQEDVRQSLAAGMSAHLAKPVEPEQLYGTLTRMIPEEPERKEDAAE